MDFQAYILIAAMALAFLVTFLLAPPLIAFLRWKKLGQQIRDDGPQRHLGKAGTPTMGGVVILAGLVAGTVASWYFFRQEFLYSVQLLALFVAVAGIGAIDDWGKIRRGRSLGLRAREKLILQFLAATLFVAALVFGLHNGTSIGVPFVGEIELNRWVYIGLAVLFIAAMSNAVNLTDGLDGLAGGVTVAAAFALAAIAWFASTSEMITLPIMRGQAIGTFLACLAAACIGFLWYNRHPAKVFMGDTGSLAIGAALAGAALALHAEILLIFIGLIYMIEMWSVILQVLYFKATKGKRLFRMSPFHHHLELSGWSEPRIVTSAWFLAILLGIAGYWIFRVYG